MCFAPQRRTLFRQLNSYKCSWAEVFCTFWLGNVLRATMACTFSTSQLLKVLLSWSVLYILTSKCASVCFVHFDLEMCLTACNFSSLIWPAGDAFASLLSTLRGDKSLEKHSVSRLSCLFAHLDLLSSETFSFLIFFLLSSSLLLFFSSLLFSSLTLPISAFYLSILSEVWLQNFLRPFQIKSNHIVLSHNVIPWFF